MQERETTARAAAVPVPATLRSIAVGYENLVRRYPKSGYADNALWQGASLLELAYDASKAKRDKDAATRLLTWLKREYPASALAKQAALKLARSEPTSPTSTPASSPMPVSPVPSRQPLRRPRLCRRTPLNSR